MVARYIPQLMAIGAVLAAYRIFTQVDFISAFAPQELRESYDYIVVGAGTSGSVIASRLSEDDERTVLVLEAGGDPGEFPDIDIPIFADHVVDTEYDWQYKTVPQRSACKGHVDNTAKLPSGKCLGGTSTMNHMQYLRGSRHDYDEWAKNGAHGWAYKDVLPYFIKSEDNRNGEFVRTVFHGFGGRMTVSDVEASRTTEIMTSAFKEVGVKRRDINGRSQYGYSQTQATILRGARWSTDKAFLSRTVHRENVDILTKAAVTKIVFEGKKAVGVKFEHDGEVHTVRADKEVLLCAGTIVFEGKKAVGVKFEHDGEVHTVRADKEVLLCAGTVGSTKLLLLSGVGPRNHLQAIGIPVVADLPVGDNLQDQVLADGVEFFTDNSVSINAARAENFLSAWAYSLYGGGMKASPRFREGNAFIRIRHQPAHMKYPLIGLQVVANVGAYTADFYNVKTEIWKAVHGKPPTRDGIIIYPVLLKPRSRGTIRLQSADPADDPLINPNYLAEDADAKILVEGFQYARRLGNTKTFQDWGLKLTNKALPECAAHGNFTDHYIECLIRHITLPGNNPVGTCKIGAVGDPSAVVDPLLKVRGLKNLRVIDASIIPNSLSGNVYATQVMIAEKASDILREKDTVVPIKEYFKHLIAVRHEKFKDEEELAHERKAAEDKLRKEKENGKA